LKLHETFSFRERTPSLSRFTPPAGQGPNSAALDLAKGAVDGGIARCREVRKRAERYA
jgi:hypothetical protein